MSVSLKIKQANSYKPLLDLVDFALALKERLKEINQESFNDFVLRVGEYATGPHFQSLQLD